MQYLNDDNIDELFRRAADDYPLNTDTPDWDTVSSALEAAAAEAEPKLVKKNTGYRKYLWLLLLLPIAWICNGSHFMNDSTFSADQISVKQPANQETPASTNRSNKEGNAPAGKSASKIPTSGSKERGISQQSEKSEEITKSNGPKTSAQAAGQPTDSRSVQVLTDSRGPAVTGSKKIAGSPSRILQMNAKPGKGLVAGQYKASVDPVKGSEKDQEAVADKIPANEKQSNPAATGESKTDLGQEINKEDLEKKTPPASVEKTNAAQDKTIQPLSKQKPATANNHTMHTLYAGLVSGFDVSTVKFQSVKNTGFSAGILLGYQLGKKLSIESGFLLDKKFYYTDAKYFSLNKIYIPPNVKLTDINGNCYMFELPVNIKYNWSTTAHSSWFSTLGLSTYIMKKESYNYTYEYSGNPGLMNYAKTYDNTSTTWFGIINLSAGYMHTLGKAGSLRVEPYVKIPAQGLGIGNLSIWSTGVYVSFIKPIFSK
jgi:hypothetical protein